MAEQIKLQRLDGTSWGFRLTGGLDFGTPITIVKVVGGSIAAEAGIQVGDIVTEINGKSTKQLTHTEAQNWIVRSGNLIYLKVIRGSVVTPPHTPFRGMTPMTVSSDGLHGFNNNDIFINDDYYDVFSSNNCFNDGSLKIEDGLTEREYTLLNGGEVPRPFIGVKVPSEAITDLELDELLTGNEEVLDQGLLGINFQKYFPQVDFIKQSEVFKLLQGENTHKDIPEQVQLQIDPTKRFSTFLQKPKPPPATKKVGPYWHYPKAPNYLPRASKPPVEQPRRRKEDTHSVLWLFLRKEGDKVIDERWGTPDEERKNVSRNTNRDDEGTIMPPLSHSNTPVPCSGDTIAHTEESMSFMKGLQLLSSSESANELQEKKLNGLEEIIDKTVKENSDLEKSPIELEIKENEVLSTSEEMFAEFAHELNDISIQEDNETICELKNAASTPEEDLELQNVVVSQLSQIHEQIAELEAKAPKDISSYLFEVQLQLNKILQLKQISKQEEQIQINDEIIGNGSCEIDLEKDSSMSVTSESEYVINYTINPYNNKQENTDDFNFDICNLEEEPTLTVLDTVDNITNLERFEVGEFEICDTKHEQETAHPDPPKKVFHPLTPAARPIVLPGGRQWRKPEDAIHNDFYQGILVEEAEVLIGNNKSVNFKKYVPPKFDTDASPVCKLIQELEKKTDSNKQMPENQFYHTALTKRHFYNVTLPQPPPIGIVELKDLF